jgi:diaminopimelate decarboxylase
VSPTALTKQDVLQAAVRQGLLGANHPLAGFLDIDGIRRSVADLQGAFARAPEVLHAFAAKANPLVPVLHL